MKPNRVQVSLCVVVVLTVGVCIGVRSSRANAPQGRYVVADGVVTDTQTRLNWQQADDATTRRWEDAKDYCSGLALEGGGWRLPTANELETLVDETRDQPAIDTVTFPETKAYWYWTSSLFAGSSGFAWHVNFDFGYSNYLGLFGNRNYVRCVR